MDTFSPFVLGIAGMGVFGFVAWTVGAVITNKTDLHKLELKVTHDYVRKDSFDEFRKEFRAMSSLMFEIAGKLGIPVRRE